MSNALPPATPPDRRRTVPVTLAVLVGTLVLCRLWTTGVWHGLDAYQFLGRIEQGLLHNDRHPLYPFLAHAVARVLVGLGMPWFDAVVAGSSLGTAIGVACVHRALLALGLDRAQALLATGAVGGCFGILYFGTVIEIHGVFFAFAGAAWWAFAAFLRRPGCARAAALGVATGLAASAHATGHLLLGATAAFALAWRPRALSVLRLAALLLLACVVHGCVSAGLSWLTGAAEGEPFDGPVRYIARMLSLGTDWSTAGGVLWREWLRPFLPLSVLGLCALRRDLRPGALMLWGCVLVYLVAAVILLSPARTVAHPEYIPPFATIEYGAYFMPLAVPAAVLAVALLPPRRRWLVPALALANGLYGLAFPDRDPGDPAYARDALQVIDRDHARLICGGYGEVDPIMRLRPRTTEVISVYALEVEIAGRVEGTPYEYVTGWFDVQYSQKAAAGGELLITDEALRLLRRTNDGLLSRLAAEHIPAHYDLVPVARGRFHALRATRRH